MSDDVNKTNASGDDASVYMGLVQSFRERRSMRSEFHRA